MSALALPAMLLDRASRAPTPQRQKPSAKAPAFPRLGWLVLAAAAVINTAIFGLAHGKRLAPIAVAII